MITRSEVLKVISDEKATNIFKAIANSKPNSINSAILNSKMKITRKQYYNRLESLMKSGLIRRKSGKYSLTSFGKVIYSYNIGIETAVDYYWKLTALDSILLPFSSDNIRDNGNDNIKIPVEEKVMLVDKIIDNDNIKEIIISPISDTSCTNSCEYPKPRGEGLTSEKRQGTSQQEQTDTSTISNKS
jgi:hypothetical protein